MELSPLGVAAPAFRNGKGLAQVDNRGRQVEAWLERADEKGSKGRGRRSQGVAQRKPGLGPGRGERGSSRVCRTRRNGGTSRTEASGGKTDAGATWQHRWEGERTPQKPSDGSGR